MSIAQSLTAAVLVVSLGACLQVAEPEPGDLLGTEGSAAPIDGDGGSVTDGGAPAADAGTSDEDAGGEEDAGGTDGPLDSGSDVVDAGGSSVSNDAGDGSALDGGTVEAGGCRALPVDVAMSPGARTIVPGQLYGVYGVLVDELDRATVVGNSNLFVLHGATTAAGTEVWIFGATAGEPMSDFMACDGFGSDNIRSALDDAEDVKNIIVDCMGIPPANALIRHVTPHAHLDHTNSDLFVGLMAVGFDADAMISYSHADETARVFSAELCRGVPREPEYPAAVVAGAVALGDVSDREVCDRVLLEVPTQALGTWRIVASHGHMQGGTSYLNMQGGADVMYHMSGGLVGDECYNYNAGEPVGFRVLPIHASFDRYWP